LNSWNFLFSVEQTWRVLFTFFFAPHQKVKKTQPELKQEIEKKKNKHRKEFRMKVY